VIPGSVTDGTGADFWGDVGAAFPSLKGASSTATYRAAEQRLLSRFFPPLAGRRLLKTDLWDEAKNTEILRWAAERGARPVGLDLSPAIVREAGRVLAGHRPGFAIGDVRAIPFASGSCDLVYSMGTIEHFPEYREAIAEIFRVLRPGGTAIVGVPNKLDPFLRPLLVHVLNRMGAYGYGMEKSFSARTLRRLMEEAGFRVTATTGILFMPGALRMLDLWAHTRRPGLTPLTAALLRPFAWLEARVPGVRRHGYLIACVAEKPG
jgi:SAM-dependent methyltransferase